MRLRPMRYSVTACVVVAGGVVVWKVAEKSHFQDAGLAEVKSVIDIPVLGLGETTLMHALTLGRKLGLVTINPIFIPWHEDQVTRYGLQNRVVGVRAVQASVPDFIDSFASDAAKAKLAPKW